MQLLTADIMEILVEFDRNTKIKFDVVIKQNLIYLRFHCGQVFEIKTLKKGAYDKKTLNKYFNILEFTHKLSKALIKVVKETEI